MSGYGVGEGKLRALLPEAFISYVRDNRYVQRSHKNMVLLTIRYFKKLIYYCSWDFQWLPISTTIPIHFLNGRDCV